MKKVSAQFSPWASTNMGQWKAYARAMGRRGRRPLSWPRFERHISRCADITLGNSAVFGAWDEASLTFTATHWAPASDREGFRLLSAIADGQVESLYSGEFAIVPRSIVFAVTPDLGEMLTRVGFFFWGRVEVTYPHPQEKVVFVNQEPPSFFAQPVPAPTKWERMAEGWERI